MKSLVSHNVKIIIDKSIPLIRKDKLGYNHISLLGNIGLLINDMLNSLILMAHERIALEQILQEIQNKLFFDSYLFYYMSFYKLPKTVYDGDVGEIQELLTKTNLDITTMRVRIMASNIGKYPLGDSTDKDYFQRINSYFFRGIENILRFNHEEVYLPALYALLNVHQSLYEYLNAFDTKFKDEAAEYYKKCFELFNSFIQKPKALEIIEDNFQLRMFTNSQIFLHTQDSPKIDYDFCSINIRQRLWGYLSLTIIDSQAFLGLFDKDFTYLASRYRSLSEIEQILLLRNSVISLYYKGGNDLGELGITVKREGIKGFILSDYFNNYDMITHTEVTNDEIQTLFGFNDLQLRSKVANTLINLDQNVIRRETVKPHGAFEIADMEIEFRLNWEFCHLCLPFKSGQEIRKDKVSEEYIYQILKPFSYFGHKCVVVFITAKKCSQYLINYIKRIRSLNNWEIHVIQERELTALLKLNSQL